ncbi:choline ABC transporter substrate-binding protein [Pseudomonas cremoricolorata]|uniref:choline ABC transporter substrate-binding protein n=1 Tax=Pseudomonas cremoricolorata TaxID=157783 RepID=UPI0009DFEA45|nr:choline ABC transporter substrate-binding protein [Pseudomonas cremoricolorata]
MKTPRSPSSTPARSLGRWLLLGALASAPLASLQAAEAESCKTVRMGLVSWTDVIATSAIAKHLLEELGYEVKQTTASQQIIMAGIRDKRLDIYLGYWQPLMTPVVQPFLDAGQATQLPQPSLRDARTTLAVPTYLYDKGLKSFSDIARFQKSLGGKIYGLEAGVGSNQIIKQMIADDKFGLKDFRLIESGEIGIVSTLKRAVAREDDVVFFGWTPHPMNVNFDISFLSGSEDVFAPNDGKATVSTLTAPNYKTQCPNVQRLLENLTFTAEEESEMMIPIMDRAPAEQVAAQWLAKHPQRRDTWLQGVTRVDGTPLR